MIIGVAIVEGEHDGTCGKLSAVPRKLAKPAERESGEALVSQVVQLQIEVCRSYRQSAGR
jgi:hypothetical protein